MVFKRLFSIACYFTRGQYLSSRLAPLTSQLAFLLGLSSRWFCLLFAMANACNLFAPPWKASKWKSSKNSSPLLKNNIWVCAGGTKKQTGCLTYEGYTDMISTLCNCDPVITQPPSVITEIYVQPIPKRYSRPSMLADVCPFILLMAEIPVDR